jgi:hypothetical protein
VNGAMTTALLVTVPAELASIAPGLGIIAALAIVAVLALLTVTPGRR